MNSTPVKNFLHVFATFAFTCLTATQAQANPQGATVVSGDVSIVNESSTKLGITQASDKAIINWQQFSIEANEHTQFYQPSASSVVLNRVVSDDPSRILGQLTANGRVMLINQNGILFGKDAVIDVASLVATTHDIRDQDFLEDRFEFLGSGQPDASVINAGIITVADHGIATLVAPSVRNNGVIAARLGTVNLAAANGFTLDFYGTGLVNHLVKDEVADTAYDLDGNKLESFLESQGKIEADGGYVLMTANAAAGAAHSVINHSGIVEATSVSTENGKVVIRGGDSGVVNITGSIDATSDIGAGGSVEITGEKVGLFENASVDASGMNGGGTILIGGDYLGGRANAETYAELGIVKEASDVPTARQVAIGANAQLKANSTGSGDGGKIVVWADDSTLAYGNISASSLNSGNGGFIEVSGARYLDVGTINVNASAKNGESGTVLFDPGDVHIVAPANANQSFDVTDFTSSTPAGTDVNISSSNIETVLNQGTNVVIRGTQEGFVAGVDAGQGDIFVEDTIHKSSGGDARISLFAADQIFILSGVEIKSTFGKLDVNLDADFDRRSFGLVDLAVGAAIRTNGGFLNLNGSQITRNGTIDTSGNGVVGAVRQAHDYFERTSFQFLRQAATEQQLVSTPVDGETKGSNSNLPGFLLPGNKINIGIPNQTYTSPQDLANNILKFGDAGENLQDDPEWNKYPYEFRKEAYEIATGVNIPSISGVSSSEEFRRLSFEDQREVAAITNHIANAVDDSALSELKNMLKDVDNLLAHSNQLQADFQDAAYDLGIEGDDVTSMAVDLIPLVGGVKGVSEGISGKEWFTEEEMGAFDRTLSTVFGGTEVVGTVGTGGLGAVLFTGGKFVVKSYKNKEKLEAAIKVAEHWRRIRKLGEEGEIAVRASRNIGQKQKISINGRDRIPDGMTRGTLSEVKNVKKLSYSQQLRDYADHAKKEGLQFDLYVRRDTELTQPLIDAISRKEIRLNFIPQ